MRKDSFRAWLGAKGKSTTPQFRSFRDKKPDYSAMAEHLSATIPEIPKLSFWRKLWNWLKRHL